MSVRINSEAPNFTAETTQGKINFHEWIGNGWAILFSHPKDFTPVCTTELGYMAGLQPEFAKRNCKIIGLSVDPVSSHRKWAADIEETQGHRVNYPLIGDPGLKGQCCNFVVESEVGIAMRDLTRCSEQTKNEAMEQTDLRTAARLTFADHMDRFVTGDRVPCSPE